MVLRAVVPALLLAGCSSLPSGAPSGTPWAALSGEPSATLPSALAAALPPVAAGSERHISLVVGGRRLHEDSVDRGHVEDQPVGEIQLDHRGSSGFGWEYGVGRSQNHGHLDGFKVGADFTEAYIGMRQTFFDDADVQPYLSLGGAAVHGDVDFGTGDDDDGWTFCPYARLGVQWQLDDFRLGLEYRRSWGTFHFSGPDFDADYDQLAMTFGFRF